MINKRKLFRKLVDIADEIDIKGKELFEDGECIESEEY